MKSYEVKEKSEKNISLFYKKIRIMSFLTKKKEGPYVTIATNLINCRGHHRLRQQHYRYHYQLELL